MHKLRYVPDNFEKLYMNMLQIFLTQNGFHNACIPPIYLSFLKMPSCKTIARYTQDSCTADKVRNSPWSVLITHEDMMEAAEKKQKEVREVSRKQNLRQNRNESQTIREKILSPFKKFVTYCSETHEIILHPVPISKAAELGAMPVEIFRTILVIHAIHQWLAQIIPENTGHDWNDQKRAATTENQDSIMSETVWAQFFVYWSANEAEDLCALVCDTVNHYLFCLYQTQKECHTVLQGKASAYRQEQEELPMQHKKLKQHIIPFKQMVAIGIFGKDKISQN
jgi:hypothetical protein